MVTPPLVRALQQGVTVPLSCCVPSLPTASRCCRPSVRARLHERTAACIFLFHNWLSGVHRSGLGPSQAECRRFESDHPLSEVRLIPRLVNPPAWVVQPEASGIPTFRSLHHDHDRKPAVPEARTPQAQRPRTGAPGRAPQTFPLCGGTGVIQSGATMDVPRVRLAGARMR